MTAALPYRASVPHVAVQGALALDLGPRLDPPAAPTYAAAVAGDADLTVDLRTRRHVQQWAHRYLQAATEIVAGDRPVSQLLRWSSPRVYSDLGRRAQLVWRATGREPGQGRVRVHTGRPQVRSSRLSFVRPDAAEASATVAHGGRCRAVAARFEEKEGRWVCVALEFA